jgi:tRNA(Ile2) C34 agmatinyltransferase TiaS
MIHAAFDYSHKELNGAPCPRCCEGGLESQGRRYGLRCNCCAARVDPNDLEEWADSVGYDAMIAHARESAS